MARSFGMLVAALLLAGCAWPGAHPGGDASGTGEPLDPLGSGPSLSMGQSVLVAVENRAQAETEARVRLVGHDASEGPFTVMPGSTAQRELPLAGPGSVEVELAYQVRGAGGSAGGTQSTTADPDSCSGTIRVLFVIEAGEGTYVTAHGRCVRG